MSDESLHVYQKIEVMEDKHWPFLLFHENSASSKIEICQTDYQSVESSKECACSETAFVSGKVQHQASWSLPRGRLDQTLSVKFCSFFLTVCGMSMWKGRAFSRRMRKSTRLEPFGHLGLSKNERFSNYPQFVSTFVAKEAWRSPLEYLELGWIG